MIKKLTILFLLLSFQASAFTYYVPRETFWQKVKRCTWHLSCYQTKLGAFTQIADSDSQVDFPALYNANLDKTIEVGSTSIAAITTLPGLTTASALASIGTITTGVWRGTLLELAYGGTASTTSGLANRVVLGNGSSAYTLVGDWGSSGQLLTSNGANNAPTWTSPATDLTINYGWTGYHTFNKEIQFNGTSTKITSATTTITSATTTIVGAGAVGIGTSTPSIAGSLNIGTTTYFSKGVGIGVATNTSNPNLVIDGQASTSVLVVSNTCVGCFQYTGSSTSYNSDAGQTIASTIPASANFGIGTFSISDTDAPSNGNGTFFIARSGITVVTVSTFDGKDGASEADGTYSFTWSGSSVIISEDTDAESDSAVSGTIYWYR